MNSGVLATAPKALWYLTRASGIVSLLLLTAAVLLGITTTTRWASAHWPRFVIEGLHKNVSLLATVFLGVHIASAVVDGYVPIRWLDVLVPFGSAYRALWLGLGAVAFDFLVAVVVTSILRVHVGHRVWRAVHWLAYACWPVAVLHGLGTGSDAGQSWMLLIDAGAAALVAGAVWWRLTVGNAVGARVPA